MTQPKRILITGASGFIGSHLVRIALNEGYEVTVAVRPSTKQANSTEGIRRIQLDYGNEEAMLAVLAGEVRTDGEPAWHYVIHNAGLTKTPRLKDFYEANAENTRRLCAVLRRPGLQPERFLFVSSLSSYSDLGSQDGVLRITDPQRPTTEYGRSKLLAEGYVKASGLRYTILHPTGGYGSGEQDYLMAIKGIKQGLNFMAGLQPQTLTFVHGEDVARACLFLLNQSEAEGQGYIITDGETYTDEAFAALVKELLGTERLINLRTPLPILWCICQVGGLYARLTGQAIALNPDKYPLMRQRSWRADVSPLWALGWRPRYDLREGLRETIAWGKAQGLL